MATRFIERAADFPGSASDQAGNAVPMFVDSDDEKFKVYDKTNSQFRALVSEPSGSEFGTVTQITSSSTGVTVNARGGQITTVALTTAAAAEEEFTVTNNKVAATDVIALSTTYAGAGTPALSVKGVAAGSFVVNITNLHAANALNALMVINFRVLKQQSASY